MVYLFPFFVLHYWFLPFLFAKHRFINRCTWFDRCVLYLQNMVCIFANSWTFINHIPFVCQSRSTTKSIPKNSLLFVFSSIRCRWTTQYTMYYFSSIVQFCRGTFFRFIKLIQQHESSSSSLTWHLDNCLLFRKCHFWSTNEWTWTCVLSLCHCSVCVPQGFMVLRSLILTRLSSCLRQHLLGAVRQHYHCGRLFID